MATLPAATQDDDDFAQSWEPDSPYGLGGMGDAPVALMPDPWAATVTREPPAVPPASGPMPSASEYEQPNPALVELEEIWRQRRARRGEQPGRHRHRARRCSHIF